MRGCTGPQVLLFLGIAALLGWIGFLQVIKLCSSGRYVKGAVNQRSIVMSLISYSNDNKGHFPSHDLDGAAFTSSTNAYQYLIRNSDGLKEEYFYVPGNPEKRNWANNDGELLPEENCLAYVTGLNTSMPPDSPITADEMESTGVYGANHPWLKDGFAVVGYLGGHAKVEWLTKRRPGATVKGPRQTKIKDIFQPRPAGLLAVPCENILQP